MMTVPNYGYAPYVKASHSDASYLEKKAVSELYKQMKDQSHYQQSQPPPSRSVSSAANLTSLCVDISPSCSNFFEVLYIGKIKVWQKKVPETFIDDALEKFRLHEYEKNKQKMMLGHIGRLKSENYILRRGSNDSSKESTPPPLQRSVSSITNMTVRSALDEQKMSLSAAKRSCEAQKMAKTPSEEYSIAKAAWDDQKIGKGGSEDQRSAKTASEDQQSPQAASGGHKTTAEEQKTAITASERQKIVRIASEEQGSAKTVLEDHRSAKTASKDQKSALEQQKGSEDQRTTSDDQKSALDHQQASEDQKTTSDDQKTTSDHQKTSSDHQKPKKNQEVSETSSDEDKPSLPDKYLRMSDEYMRMTVEDEHNRTMVLQVDRTDLRLISPDRKVILLHKQHRDVATCIQGITRAEHFGFICRDPASEHFMGYVFKCESSSIATDAVAAITQSFCQENANNPKVRPAALTSCEHCPLVWYHKLCADVEHMSDRKTQAAILRRLDELEPEEQTAILAKYRGVETDSLREQNEFLMMLLRAHCEMKQTRHVHDTAENRSEFLNQYLGGGTIFMKAKRSLSNSFEMLKRKASKDDFGPTLREMNLPLNRETSPHSPTVSIADVSDRESEGSRSRSSTIGSQSDIHLCVNKERATAAQNVPERCTVTPDKSPKSPMMDIFLKVGSSPKAPGDETSPKQQDGGSWRQAIFKRVTTPSKQDKSASDGADKDGKSAKTKTEKKSRAELRELWRKAICQAILLVRMEKENARLKARQEESAVKRIKLEYDEMKPMQREVMDVWEMLTNNKDGRMKCDKQMLLHAIRQGVPRGKRGEVWQYLAEQYCSKVPPFDTSNYPNYNVPYETLLKQLTSHQHAILIDLGRTFPNHSYFSSPLGPGQLALFNLLKAYSLLDSEMGYCQGMSFIAGVLLLHMEESQAFFLLRHLMFRRGLRCQYLPDMGGLQVKLYQLSRLLHDQLSDLYNHFDAYEVAPTLYAAPWLLTIFASQFPLGFVTRVFDLIFLEGPDVIFRVVVALLSYHKEQLMACDNFEDIMEYLKNNLPNIDKPTLDKVMKQVFSTDITRQLHEYKVEYQVLQEEMQSVQPQMDSLHRLESENKSLTERNRSLTGQLELAHANVQRLEKNRVLQQSQLNRVEMQSRALDVTIATLGGFISNLIEERKDIEIPDEVRRILNQIQLSERRKPQNNNLMKMFQKSAPEHADKMLMVKSLSTGKIQIPNNLEMLSRSNSLNAQALKEEIENHTNKSQNSKVSPFFSSSHSNILQRKYPANPKIDIKIQEVGDNVNEKSVSLPLQDSKEIASNEKSVSLPLPQQHGDIYDVSPTDSVDSGVGTPVKSPQIEAPHPLSNCDVNFTFNGTRELKNIKSLRNMTRNSSPDIISK